MSYETPGSDDLTTFLGTDTNADRATLLIGLAEKLCKSVVSPLPDGAEATVLAVASRAYANPQNAQFAATGPYSTSYGTTGGGLWLTSRDEATIRRLAGGGGAFTIDPTPADAGPANYWAQVPENLADVTSAPFLDWDGPPA